MRMIFSAQKRMIVVASAVALLIASGGGIWRLRQNWGIQISYFSNMTWNSAPQSRKREFAVELRGDEIRERLATNTFSVKWQGWIVIPATGEYQFATDSDDGSVLLLNRQRVVDNGGAHGLQKASGAIFLERGSYPLEILYFNAGGFSVMKAFWTPPNAPETPLPSDALFLRQPTMFECSVRRSLTRLAALSPMLGIALVLFLPTLFVVKASASARRHFRALTEQAFLKRAGFYGLLLLLLLAMFESGAWAFFTLFRERFTFFNARQYLASPEQQAKMRQWQMSRNENFAFGWDVNFATPFGERPRRRSYERPLMATFGDSFTYCDEVADHETWQTHLSDLLQGDVYNFGVGGYGTDQAYLKFLAISPKVHAPVVVLGLTTENINRIVNVYRPFYYQQTQGRTPKPRFLLKQNELALLENVIRTQDDIAKLGDPRFIEKLGQYDWWYNRDNHPRFGFPYANILLNKRMWLELYYGKANRKIDDMNPRPWEDLWDSEEARELMFRILDAFVEKAHAAGAVPLIVVLPLQYQVEEKFLTQRHDPRLVKLLTYCEARRYRVFEAITPLAERVSTQAEIQELYVGHVSPKGNRIIAEALSDYLRRELKDVLEKSSAQSPQKYLSGMANAFDKS